ncbi:MAG TPA: hypothetical protein VJR24_10680 [Gemmatimonadaceae bacterium]|nr:hypothetical protein [Gemmatimonadaceae bacterium]
MRWRPGTNLLIDGETLLRPMPVDSVRVAVLGLDHELAFHAAGNPANVRECRIGAENRRQNHGSIEISRIHDV